MSGSLSDTVKLVPDAFTLTAAEQYKPENIVIGEYTFLPWVRTGVVAGLTQTRGPVRPAIAVAFDVQDDAGGSVNVSKTLTVRGPGDVLGFDVRQIVRRYPTPGTPNAEDTFFAHIEFDRPDFLWLFTPFAPVGDRLPPWLALVVIESRDAVFRPGGPGLPQTVTTRRAEIGDLDNSWAWAHAQVIGPAAGAPLLSSRLTDAFGDVNLSRLICPRKLEPTRSYVACLVPAFDAGVRAAMGLSGGTTDAAWTRVPGDDAQEITLPVFDHWNFSTTTDGDFASLATKLVGLPAPWNVGRRVIDTSRPGGDVTDLGPDDPGRAQVIRCALTAPATATKPEGAPDDANPWSDEKTAELETQLNLPDKLSAQFVVDGNDTLPIVGPRIYARFQRGSNVVDRLAATDWFNQLNLAPVNRVVAGLGTRVVQKDREPLMQAAWAQVGAIEAVNHSIRLAQAARFVGDSLHTRHLSALSIGPLAQVTRGVQAKIKLGGAALTLQGTAARSAVATAALTPAFRRATRARGPLARYLDPAGRAALDRLVATASTVRDFRRAYVEPDGIVTLSAKALAGISAANAARVLGVDPAVAMAQVAQRVQHFATLPSAVDQLLAPVATWRPREATLDVGGAVAARLLATLHASMPSDIDSHPSRAETLGTLFVGLASSRTPAATSARESIHNIGNRLPSRVALAAPANAVGVARQGIAVAAARFETAASLQLTMTIAASRNLASAVFVPALADFARSIGAADLPATPSRPALVVARDALLQAIHPRVTVTAHVSARLGDRPSWLAPDWFHDGMVRPIMNAPVITIPMYERLDAYDRDWLVPGLRKIVQNDLVTLLETNPQFTESFLAGLSDEMGRELLWRGYPTDQRGTYFRRFWTTDDELAQDLHRFSPTELGTHLKDASGNTGRIVLVVRGELVKRYPDAITLGLRAIEPVQGHPEFVDPASNGSKPIAPILFHAFLPPDILLVGFDLTDADLVPNRWWFVIAEHPTAPRFGILNGQAPPLGAHAGIVAHDYLRDPVRAAFEASRLLAPARVGG